MHFYFRIVDQGGSHFKRVKKVLYFVVYNAHFFAQIFEGKLRMCILYVCNDYIPWV